MRDLAATELPKGPLSQLVEILARIIVIGTLVLALFAPLEACSPVALLDMTVPKSGYHLEKDLVYGNEPRQKLDLYIPDGLTTPAPVLLFFYGGSWQSGQKDDYLALGQAFASKGIIVAIADYRVFPQVRYPAFLSDGAAAFFFVHKQIANYGGDPSHVFLAGHSAGAYIAVMLASDLRYLAAVHADMRWIRGVIGIAGPYDFLPLTDRQLVTIFGGANREDTQPIHYIDGKRPPMLLVTGSADGTVSPGNTERMARRLQSFGSPVETKIYPGVGHVGIILSIAPAFRFRTTLRDDVVQFISAH